MTMIAHHPRAVEQLKTCLDDLDVTSTRDQQALDMLDELATAGFVIVAQEDWPFTAAEELRAELDQMQADIRVLAETMYDAHSARNYDAARLSPVITRPRKGP